MNLESGSILFNHSIQHVPSSFPTRANQRSITLLLLSASARGDRSVLLCVQNFECCNIVTCFLFRAERDTHLFGPGKLVIKICSHLWFRSQKNLRMRRIRKRRPKISVSSPPLAGVHGRAIFLELAESTNYATKRWRFAIFFGTARPWEVLMIDMNYTFFFFLEHESWWESPLPFLGIPCCYMKRWAAAELLSFHISSLPPVLRKTIRRRKISNQRTCRCRVFLTGNLGNLQDVVWDAGSAWLKLLYIIHFNTLP